MDAMGYVSRIAACVKSLNEALDEAGFHAGANIKLYVLPSTSYGCEDNPIVGVRVAFDDGNVEVVNWIGMADPEREDEED